MKRSLWFACHRTCSFRRRRSFFSSQIKVTQCWILDLYVIFILHYGCSKLVDTTINLDATMYSKFRCISSFFAFQVIENLIGENLIGTENRLGMIFCTNAAQLSLLARPSPSCNTYFSVYNILFVFELLVDSVYHAMDEPWTSLQRVHRSATSTPLRFEDLKVCS